MSLFGELRGRARGGLARARATAGILHGGRTFGGPVRVALDLHNSCNLRCIHCQFHSPLLARPTYPDARGARLRGEPEPEEKPAAWRLPRADTARTRSLVDELLALGSWRFQFSGNGEPLLHRDAMELFARVKRGGGACETITNGTLLHRHEIDRLVEIGFDELRVTVMAGTSEGYGATHPRSREGTFERLRDALLYLAERKRAARARRPRLRLGAVVIRENCDRLHELARLALDVAADELELKPLDDVGSPRLATLVPSEQQARELSRQLPDLRARLEEGGVDHNIDAFRVAFRGRLDTRELYGTIPCYYGWLGVKVRVDGSVYPCARCFEPLGNAHERGFAAVWSGREYQRFRDRALAIRRLGWPSRSCDCASCVNYRANLQTFRALHPLRALRGLSAG